MQTAAPSRVHTPIVYLTFAVEADGLTLVTLSSRLTELNDVLFQFWNLQRPDLDSMVRHGGPVASAAFEVLQLHYNSPLQIVLTFLNTRSTSPML